MKVTELETSTPEKVSIQITFDNRKQFLAFMTVINCGAKPIWDEAKESQAVFGDADEKTWSVVSEKIYSSLGHIVFE